ncbi:uncharacterized protein LOC129951019 [Eupeodes corollae]|uniref:uncharacterized protein LOC129951019 n=1 Tax=Eupeodes corollae TaxID=290404 RepID=UPI002492C2D8|nr:uncharacterized protein LOC129951019 [Eupeodes corollae]
MGSIGAQFVALLIEEYKGLPSLWDVDCEDYKNKNVKRKDYTTLMHSLLVVDPLLTMNELKKKIANIRSCYRRELKKIADSIRSGAKGDEIYAPTLWYFNQLDFLRDQEPRAYKNVSSRSVLDDGVKETAPTRRQVTSAKTRSISHPYKTETVNDKKVVNEPNVNVTKNQQTTPRRSEKHVKSNPPPTPPPSSYIIETQKPSPPFSYIKENQNPFEKDDANTFSETWALLFRKLSHQQQLYGKRCIDEILYQGQLGNLNAYTYRNIELSRMCSSDSESSNTNKGHCTNESNCQNYDKEISSFFSGIV